MQKTHGGHRTGAGRKNITGLRGHAPRMKIDQLRPLHVVLRLRSGLPSLKRKEIFAILRIAVKNSRRKGLAITHFSILSNHIHLLVESHDHLHLARAMQSLAVSFSKRLNGLLKRSGAVFRDRFFSRVIRGTRETRRVLRYVIANRALHDRKEGYEGPLEIHMDPFSSAFGFKDWRILGEKPHIIYFDRWKVDGIKAWYTEILAPARTWLLREGWRA